MRISDRQLLRIIVYYNVSIQILDVLRAAAIYNTSYLGNAVRGIISFLFCLFFCHQLVERKIKIDIYDIIFIGLPIAATGYGLIFNRLSYYFISDLFNAVSFGIIVNHYKEFPDIISKKSLYDMAVIEMWGVVVSLLIYTMFEMIGITIYSIGKVSNFLLFPLAVFLAYGEKKSLFVFILIILGGKRGVLLSALAMLFFFYLIDKGHKIKKVIMISLMVAAGGGLLFFTMSPERIALLPTSVQGMSYRLMKINPFSPYRDWYSGGRLDEILSVLKQFEGNEWNLIFGKGNGFVYSLIQDNVVKQSVRHNVHFTPLTLVTRYGIIYALFFYGNIFQVVRKGIKYVRQKENHILVMGMLLFLFATFVDSFTAFLPYLEYQFMLCLGALSGILIKGKVINDENSR